VLEILVLNDKLQAIPSPSVSILMRCEGLGWSGIWSLI